MITRKVFRLMKEDIAIGMAISRSIAWFIIISTTGSLRANDTTDIHTADGNGSVGIDNDAYLCLELMSCSNTLLLLHFDAVYVLYSIVMLSTIPLSLW